MDSLFIVMPAYNEETNIEAVISQWYPILSGKNIKSRLVVADSGSTDHTHEILINLQDKLKQLEILSDTERQHGPKIIALYDYAIKQGADYIFHFASFHMIFEAKTSLLAIDAKQQNPNLDSLEIFYKRTIRESYEQLQSSYQQIVPTLAEPVLKIILLYDQFSNTAVIEAANPDIFEQDRNCYIMTIRDLEILLYYHCHQPIILKKILNDLLEQINGEKPRRSINMIYQNESIYQNPHFKGELNYLSKIRDYLKRQFE